MFEESNESDSYHKGLGMPVKDTQPFFKFLCVFSYASIGYRVHSIFPYDFLQLCNLLILFVFY